MNDITYCSRFDCINTECARHQSRALGSQSISIADLNDGYCFTQKVLSSLADCMSVNIRAAICKGIQNTVHRCDDVCRAMCGIDGSCAFCATLADEIEGVLKGGSI
jgi:hypothetical protein